MKSVPKNLYIHDVLCCRQSICVPYPLDCILSEIQYDHNQDNHQTGSELGYHCLKRHGLVELNNRNIFLAWMTQLNPHRILLMNHHS